jgi:hypothetical protein
MLVYVEYAADIGQIVPSIPAMARENRNFMHRVVRYLSQAGIRQFLDIGTGILTRPNVHEIAQGIAADTEALVQADETSTAAVWTLDVLTDTANALGIAVARSQVRRILLADGVRWRQVRSWAVSKDPDFVPKGQPSSSCIPARPTTRRSSASTNSAR